MLPTLSPHQPPWAWVTFPVVFQLPQHSECQQPDPRSSMRHFRTFPSPGITAEDPPVSRTRRLAHETTSEDSPVSRMRRLAHETTLADSFVSRTRRLAHETTSEGPSVSRTRRLAQETTSEGHSVSRTRRLAHETTSEGHSVSRTRRLAHETTSEDPPVSRMRLFAHETTLEDTDKPPPVPILSPGHFGTPDKPLLYQKLSHCLFRITFFFLKSVLNCLFEG